MQQDYCVRPTSACCLSNKTRGAGRASCRAEAGALPALAPGPASRPGGPSRTAAGSACRATPRTPACRLQSTHSRAARGGTGNPGKWQTCVPGDQRAACHSQRPAAPLLPALDAPVPGAGQRAPHERRAHGDLTNDLWVIKLDALVVLGPIHGVPLLGRHLQPWCGWAGCVFVCVGWVGGVFVCVVGVGGVFVCGVHVVGEWVGVGSASRWCRRI